MGTRTKHLYEFGLFRLDATDRLLYREGNLVSLPPKVFDTLLLLVASSEQVLTKDEMMKQIWPDTFVEEGTLAQYIFLLRKALGDSAEWIENHPRRGYRFSAPVKEFHDDPGEWRIHRDGRSQTVIENETVARQRTFTRFRMIGIALVTFGVLTVAALVWTAQNHKAPSALGSVAVLPFRTVPGSSDDYLADGITEALITKLAKVKGLRVVSYSRVRKLKAASIEAAETGRQLGVDAVIEGTIRVASGRTRVSVHAIETRTADTLWAEDGFEAGSAGLLDMERKLAEAVALRFRGQLTATERALIEKSGTSNAEAYDLVLQARRMWRQGPANLEVVIRMLGEAVQRDPGYADAYGWLALAQHRAYFNGLGGSDLLRAAISSATQSLSRDPNSLIALRALSHIQHSTGRAVEGLLMARRALESNPDDLDVTAAAAEAYFRTGLHDRAISLYQKALSWEPDSDEFRRQLARIYAFSGEYNRGIELLSLLPHGQVGPFGMALYAESGQMEKAVEVVLSDRQPAPGSFGAYIGGCVLAAVGDTAGARQIWTEDISRKEALLERYENPHLRNALGYAYAKLGKRAKALHQVRQMLAPDPHHPVFLFFAAETLALLGERRDALDALKAAVENGFFNLPMIDGMSRWRIGTLHGLRNDSEFLAIRADLARRVDELRARY